MNPLLAKDTAAKTAKEMGLDPDMVEDILSFYWKTIRIILGNPKQLNVNLRHIGTFSIKNAQVRRVLDNLKIGLNTVSNTTTINARQANSKARKYVYLLGKIESTKYLIELIDKELLLKEQVKIKKHERS